jgi:hypothetical protein
MVSLTWWDPASSPVTFVGVVLEAIPSMNTEAPEGIVEMLRKPSRNFIHNVDPDKETIEPGFEFFNEHCAGLPGPATPGAW